MRGTSMSTSGIPRALAPSLEPSWSRKEQWKPKPEQIPPPEKRFEIHITFPLPVDAVQRERLESLATELGWSTSEIQRDPLLGKDSFFYWTSHEQSFHMAVAKMYIATKLVSTRDLWIRRKIEQVVLDERREVKK